MRSKAAIITGASKGIGRATALEFAKSGLEIFATARNKPELENLKEDIQKLGGVCSYRVADLTVEVEVDHFVKQIIKKYGKISVLVHSAGIAHVGSVSKFPISSWHDTMNINLTAPFLLTQKCLPYLDANANIFFINSTAGKNPFADWSAYCASKFGLKAFTDCLRNELQPKGIKVTSIFPASVDTPMQDKIPYNWDRSKMLKANDIAQAILNCYKQ